MNGVYSALWAVQIGALGNVGDVGVVRIVGLWSVGVVWVGRTWIQLT